MIEWDGQLVGMTLGFWAVISVMIWKLWGLGMEGQTTNKILATVIMLPVCFFIIMKMRGD